MTGEGVHSLRSQDLHYYLLNKPCFCEYERSNRIEVGETIVSIVKGI